MYGLNISIENPDFRVGRNSPLLCVLQAADESDVGLPGGAVVAAAHLHPGDSSLPKDLSNTNH